MAGVLVAGAPGRPSMQEVLKSSLSSSLRRDLSTSCVTQSAHLEIAQELNYSNVHCKTC